MLNRNFGIGLIIAGIATLIMCGAALVALLMLYHLASREAGVPAVVFACVNLVMLVAMVPVGKIVSYSISHPASVQLWFVTILYSIVQFITLFLASDAWGNVAYTLFQLVALALWLGIAGAVVSMGKRQQ